MHGASTESLAVLTEVLDSALDGAGRDHAARMADDLFGVSAILRREPGLRRVATDVSVDSAAKADLVRSVFAEQLAGPSLHLVAQAAGRRWAASRDLADSLEQLGVVAVVKGADAAGKADQLEDELFWFGRVVADNPDLRDALSDPARSIEDKRALVEGLLNGRTDQATIRLAGQAVAGSHRTVSVAIEEYQKVAAAHRNRLVATVRVARSLAEEDMTRLESALAGQYGRPVHLNVVVDPDVIGGMRVKIGDDVIDGTVASRLDDARRRLAG